MSHMETMHSNLTSPPIFSYRVTTPGNAGSSGQGLSLCSSFYVLFYEQLSFTRAVCVTISIKLSYRDKWAQFAHI